MKWRGVGLLLLAFAGLLLFGGTATAASPSKVVSPSTHERLSPNAAGQIPGNRRSTAPTHRLHRVSPGFGVLLGGSIWTTPNWAGYDVTGGSFTSVTATWVQPAIQANYSSTSYQACFWVGLDGDGSSTVEQTGTWASTQNGSVSYCAWYEMFPDYEVPISGLYVNPGNIMTATVTTDGFGDFTLTITNDTTGYYYTTNQFSDAAEDYSAEVIAEAPSTGGGIEYSLADFGTVNFTGCAIDGASVSSYNWNRLNMVLGNASTLATTSTLGADGASFSVANGGVTPTPTPTATPTATPAPTPTPAPSPPITTVAGADASWHKSPVTLTFTASDPGGPGVKYTDYSVDGGGWTVGTSVTIAAPANHANDGTHTIRYSSTDNDGNAGPIQTCQVKIDTAGPACAAKNVTVKHGKACRLYFRVHDSLSSKVTNVLTITTKSGHVKKHWSWGYGENFAGWWWMPYTCRLPKGTYYIRVYGKDLAGNAQSVVGKAYLHVK